MATVGWPPLHEGIVLMSHQSDLTECLHLKNPLHIFCSASLAVAMFLWLFLFTALVFIGVY